MDIHFYLREFESFMRMRFGGDDPLDAWDKFVNFLDTNLPLVEKCNMDVVIERLVKSFLEDNRYHDDLRFINYCIRCATSHPDPVEVYSRVHSCGVGMQMAALYVSWAQEFERKDLKAQAEQVYQKAFKNRAEPLDFLQHHYRLFRTREGESQATDSAAGSGPLQHSLHQTDGVQLQSEAVVDFPVPVYGTIISHSENNPPPNRSSTTKCVSVYCVKELVCEGSELTFEELRAQRYFTKLGEQELNRQRSEVLRGCLEKEQEVIQLKKQLEELNLKLSDEVHLQQPKLECASREKPLTGGHTECTTFVQQHEMPHSDAVEETEADEDADVSYGGRDHSRITPNTSLGLISATPSRALPSPTVNTREALDVIGIMFQGPTLLQDSVFNATHSDTPAEESGFKRNCRLPDFAPLSAPHLATPSAPFRIYQDENENRSLGVESQVEKKPKPTPHRALMEIPVSKATVTSVGPESLTDDSIMWGPGRTPMAFFPNHTQDLSLSAPIASTPLHPITPYSRDSQHSQVGSKAEENLHLHQPAKLSPILEQSPNEEKQCDGAMLTLRAQGNITGECASQQEHAHSLTHTNQTNTSISRQTPVFPNQSIAPTEELRSGTKPSWSIYRSPSGEMEKRKSASGGDLNSSSLQCNLNSKLNSSSLKLVKKLKQDRADSQEELILTSLQCNSNFNSPIWLRGESDSVQCNSNTELRSSKLSKPLHCNSDAELHSHGQNPVRNVNPGHLKFNQQFSMSRLCPFGELGHKKLNILQEIKPDRVNLNRSQLSDIEEANIPSERSFTMCRSANLLSEDHQIQQWKSCMVPQSPDPVLRAIQDVPMSPVQPAKPDLDVMVGSPPQASRPGLNVHSDQHSFPLLNRSGFLLSKQSFDRRRSERVLFPRVNAAEKSACASPCRSSDPIPCDVPMSPELKLNSFCSETPEWEAEADLDVIMTPENNKTCSVLNVWEASLKLNCDDVFMRPAPPSAPPTSSALISDPWNDDLIASLLAGLCTPLSSYSNLSTWPCCIPPITPKRTVQMGDECLHVDCVVGRGAFATVYQATNLNNSRKVVMKVQKPSNPWEFYINVQLNTRMEPRARHLYDQLHAAHLFNNGSVLIGDLHNCGTLLDVINLYKSHSEKVMPQPLVLYFTICILDMVERLHGTRIIHADIKPDNFLLGDRFLENKDLSEENLEHGLALIDFGQSIDMTLFPDGAQFMACCMTSGFQCTEMLSGRPWTYQTDYFGVAGTVYCMLFGSYMQVQSDGGVWKTGGVFKRNPHRDLWQDFFHTLLNVPDCTSLLSLSFLRERLSAALLDNYSSKLLHHKVGLKTKILESRTFRR